MYSPVVTKTRLFITRYMELKKNNHSLQIRNICPRGYIYIRFSRFSYRENTRYEWFDISKSSERKDGGIVSGLNQQIASQVEQKTLNDRTGILRIVNNRNMCCAKVDILCEISTSFGFRNYLRTRLNFSS